jgi:exopolysaccharide production protein ExoZ
LDVIPEPEIPLTHQDGAQNRQPSFGLHKSLPSPSRIKQIDGLQLMRAMAVALVAWGHAGLHFGLRLPDFGIFGIDLFFVISGFIMSSIVLHSDEQPGWPTTRRFLVRRLIRIYPVFWIYAALSAIRVWHNGYLAQHNYWASVFLLPFPHHWKLVDFSWTLIFEMFFYSVLGVVLLFTVRRAVEMMIVLLAAMVCLSGIVDMTAERWAVVANPILLEFVYGAIVALLFYRFGRRKMLGMGLLLAGTAAALYIRHYRPPAANGMVEILYGGRVLLRSVTWGGAAALVIAGMVFWSPEVRSRFGRLGIVIGNASYSIYLGSALVIEFGARALEHLRPIHNGDSALVMATYQGAVVMLVLVCGWLSYQFIEWPLVRRLQRRFAERKPKVAVPVREERVPAS